MDTRNREQDDERFVGSLLESIRDTPEPPSNLVFRALRRARAHILVRDIADLVFLRFLRPRHDRDSDEPR